MSEARKSVKVVSILFLLEGLLSIVAGILMLAGVANVHDWSQFAPLAKASDAGLIASLASALVCAVGVYELVKGWLGVKGANQPSKIGPFTVLTVIATIYYVGSFIYLMVTSGFEWTTAVNAFINAFAIVSAVAVRNEALK